MTVKALPPRQAQPERGLGLSVQSAVRTELVEVRVVALEILMSAHLASFYADPKFPQATRGPFILRQAQDERALNPAATSSRRQLAPPLASTPFVLVEGRVLAVASGRREARSSSDRPERGSGLSAQSAVRTEPVEVRVVALDILMYAHSGVFTLTPNSPKAPEAG